MFAGLGGQLLATPGNRKEGKGREETYKRESGDCEVVRTERMRIMETMQTL